MILGVGPKWGCLDWAVLFVVWTGLSGPCNWTQERLLAAQPPVNWGASFGGEEMYLTQKGEQLGKWWAYVQRPKVLPNRDSFNGRREKHSQFIFKVRSQILGHFGHLSIACRPVDFSWCCLEHCLAHVVCLQLDVFLPTWSTCKFTKENLGVEGQSSFNYLILHLYPLLTQERKHLFR